MRWVAGRQADWKETGTSSRSQRSCWPPPACKLRIGRGTPSSSQRVPHCRALRSVGGLAGATGFAEPPLASK